MTRRELRRFWVHNLVGHGLGYCVVGLLSPKAGQLLHDFTIPTGER